MRLGTSSGNDDGSLLLDFELGHEKKSLLVSFVCLSPLSDYLVVRFCCRLVDIHTLSLKYFYSPYRPSFAWVRSVLSLNSPCPLTSSHPPLLEPKVSYKLVQPPPSQRY